MKLGPALHQALKEESFMTNTSIHKLILMALNDRYMRTGNTIAAQQAAWALDPD